MAKLSVSSIPVSADAFNSLNKVAFSVWSGWAG
jgi:hypothetical protein